MALLDLADVQTGNNFVAPTPWKAAEHAQVCRLNFQQTETRLAALELVAPTTSAVILKATVTLNNTQIKALPTTSVALIASPGINNRIVPLQVDLYRKFAAGAYTNTSVDGAYLAVFLGFQLWSEKVIGSVSSALGDFATFFGAHNGPVTLLRWGPTTQQFGLSASADLNNNTGLQPTNVGLNLVINNGAGGDLTSGNSANTLKARVLYMIESEA